MNNAKKTPGQIAFEAHNKSRTDWIGQTDWGHQCESSRNAFEAAALAVLASQWRPVTEPPENKFEPVFMWIPDGATSRQFHGAHCSYVWWMPIPPLPPEPIDPYAELKAAHAAGKVIQEDIGLGDWCDLDDKKPFWNLHHSRYRIKPWTLSRHLPGFRALEPGEEWHRSDFTEEMLPKGWRPLLMGENPDESYEAIPKNSLRGGEWEHVSNLGYSWESHAQFARTTRPLPPTKQELERAVFEWWDSCSGGGELHAPPAPCHQPSRSWSATIRKADKAESIAAIVEIWNARKV